MCGCALRTNNDEGAHDYWCESAKCWSVKEPGIEGGRAVGVCVACVEALDIAFGISDSTPRHFGAWEGPGLL